MAGKALKRKCRVVLDPSKVNRVVQDVEATPPPPVEATPPPPVEDTPPPPVEATPPPPVEDTPPHPVEATPPSPVEATPPPPVEATPPPPVEATPPPPVENKHDGKDVSLEAKIEVVGDVVDGAGAVINEIQGDKKEVESQVMEKVGVATKVNVTKVVVIPESKVNMDDVVAVPKVDMEAVAVAPDIVMQDLTVIPEPKINMEVGPAAPEVDMNKVEVIPEPKRNMEVAPVAPEVDMNKVEVIPEPKINLEVAPVAPEVDMNEVEAIPEPKGNTNVTEVPPEDHTKEKAVITEPEPNVDKEEEAVMPNQAVDMDESIEGTILELEQDEISTPKGPRKEQLGKSPDFPQNPHWIKPEILLSEIFEKRFILRVKEDSATAFTFPSDPNVTLQPYLWKIPELCALKDELNKVKLSLDEVPLNRWHYHTNRMDIANTVMGHVTKYFNPEFSSRAWGKMFEMLCSYEIVPDPVFTEAIAISEDKERKKRGDKVAFDTVHLCEAPGAFISALNHFLNNSYTDVVDWNWLATSLNPYHESNHVQKKIPDDRLILKSMDNWTFLEDKTGNILSLENLEYLIKLKTTKMDKVREEQGQMTGSQVYLVTADGNVDCEANPTEQEAIMAHLQFAEILTAMTILRKGGSFVLKIFTFLEPTTICHLYLLSCVFNEVHLFKPAVSKEGNSEVYVICLDFLGTQSVDCVLQYKLLPNLENYGNLLKEGKVLLPLEAIPKVFLDRLIESAQFFCNHQMKIIKRNLSTFRCDTRIYSVMKPFRKEVAEEWIEWNQIKPLTSRQRLFDGDVVNFQFKIEGTSTLETRADKVLRQTGTDFQKLEAFKSDLMMFNTWKNGSEHRILYETMQEKVGPIEFERAYANIRCSRFCVGKLLETREGICQIVRQYKNELQEQGLGNMGNICSGHTPKRVYESMAKSCNVEFKDLEVLCFTQLTWDFVTKTDFSHQKKDLQRLVDSVSDMGKDRSMFLCRFPLLSRLQAGIIFCLTSVFEKIIIYGDPGKNVIGILLLKCKGVSRSHMKSLFRCISDILDLLNNNEQNYPSLQLVPMKLLLDFMPQEFLVKYNTLILCQDMLRTANVVECIIRLNQAMEQNAFPKPIETET